MSRRLFSPLYLVLALGLVIAPCAASAEDAPKEKLHKLETEMAAQKKQAAALEQQGKETAGNLQELRRKLIDATEALQGKEGEQQKVEDRLRGIEDEIASKNAGFDKTRDELSVLTDVLVRLSRQPPETYFLQAGLTDEHIHRAILARSLIPRLQTESDAMARDLAVLSDLRRSAQEQRRLVAAARQNLRSQQTNLDQLVQARQGFLTQTQEQKAATLRQLVSLTGEAQDLRQLLDKVSPPGSRSKPGLDPHLLLERPVAGAIIHNFGWRDADGVTSHGLTFKAVAGSRVVAPAAGKVVFAGPFRGYGQILILQHKGGYHSFLAGFGRIDTEMGQEVAAGEPLGILPVKGDAGRPELYFEWRRNGEPVDPMEQKFRSPASP